MTLPLLIFITICLYFCGLSVLNILTLKKYTHPPRPVLTPGKKISVLIPARNEEDNIGRCLDSLLQQDYPDYEILVIDDNSTDRTWSILQVYAARDERVRIFAGKPLAPGWVGKQYACQQLSREARGDYLLFSDADTVHGRQSLSWALTNLEDHQADFLSAYLRHTIGSAGEAVLIPAIYLMTTLVLPLWKVPQRNHPCFSFAIGQLLFCRAEAFRKIGGYTQFKDSMVEDMSMARTMKAHGFKTLFLDASDYVSCRMYSSFRSSFNGFVKNLYSALGRNVPLLLGLIALVSLVIELPFWSFTEQVLSGRLSLFSLQALPVLIFLCTWALVLHDRKVPLVYTLLYPLLFFNIILIALFSLFKTGLGKGVAWKGRLVRCEPKPVYGEEQE